MSIFFNGTTQYCNIANNSSLNITGAITISTWFRCNGSPGNWKYVFAKPYDGETGLYWIATNDVANTLWCGIRWGTGITQYNAATATLASVFDNNWHQVTLTSDTTSLVLHIDGVAGTPVTLGGSSIIAGTYHTTVAAYDPLGEAGAGLELYGPFDIAEIRLYNRALSEEEVMTIYSSVGTDDIWYGIVSKWLFQGALGSTASGANSIIDIANNGNHLTPANNPSFTESILKYSRFMR